MPFELVAFPNGTHSLLDLTANEAMHSYVGPWEEANRVYVEPSRLRERLTGSDPSPLVLYDVGMGIATNALAAIAARETLAGPARQLHIISFETDLGGLEKSIECASRFPFISGRENLLEELLKSRHWSSNDDSIQWNLLEGPLLDRVSEAPPAELIYFDFYSPGTVPELWTIETFRTLRAKTRENATLHTYVAATAARVAMLLGGFYVGRGPATPAKKETTIASVSREPLERLLDQVWAERLIQAEKPFPMDWRERDEKGRQDLVKAVLAFMTQITAPPRTTKLAPSRPA